VVGNNSYYTSKGNHFRHNTYELQCQQTPFAWKDPTGAGDYAYVTPGQWEAFGNDTTGEITRDKRCS
jgi:hypothetical protein